MMKKKFNTCTISSQLLICILMISFSNCQKKEDNYEIAHKTFLRTISIEGFQSGKCIKQTEDGNILVFWVDYDDTTNSQISKMDIKGNLIWKRGVKGSFEGAHYVYLDDGGILISAPGNFVKLDKNGEIEILEFPEIGGSFPLRVKSTGPYNENYMLSNSDGISHGGASNNTINMIDNFGKDKKINLQFPDTYFNAKVLALNIYRFEDPNIFYFWGFAFPAWTGSWAANMPTFFAKIQLDNNNKLISKKVKFLDSADFINFNNYLYTTNPFQLVNKDKSLLLAVSLKNANTGLQQGRLTLVDSNLNILWKKYLPFEGSSYSILSISHTNDGNYLICGKVLAPLSKVFTPFFCKLDKNGNVIWKNTFKTPLYGEAWWGTELNDGGYMFTGNTSSFGRDLGYQDLFLLKTDNFGNLSD